MEQEKHLIKEYKKDFVSFFKQKICPGNNFNDSDAPTQTSSRQGGQEKNIEGGAELKTRSKNRPTDSVEKIAENVQYLIKFGREKYWAECCISFG